MSGAAEKKHPKDVAGRIFDLMAAFAKYGFPKAHSAAYAPIGLPHCLVEDALSRGVYGGLAYE